MTLEGLKKQMQLQRIYVYGDGEMAKVVMNFQVTWDSGHGLHFQVDEEELMEDCE